MELLFDPRELPLLDKLLITFAQPAMLIFREPIQACVDPEDLGYKFMVMEEELFADDPNAEKIEVKGISIPVYREKNEKIPLPDYLRVGLNEYPDGIEIYHFKK